VQGRRYQGQQQVAVRAAGMGAGSSSLTEAVALSLVGLSGEPTQRFTFASFAVNDRPMAARLLVEHPDEQYAAALGTGVLYKSLATGQFTYQGEDPTAYVDDFKQVNRNGSQDLQPVIDLIRWVNEATDEQFAAELSTRVDIESLARYAALQNLLLNFDDMAGPGRNYFLWYDLTSTKFRVISWDYNLAFSGSPDQGPRDASRMGGGFGGGGFPPQGGLDLPEGFEPPENFEPPEGFQPPAGGGGPGGGGGFASGHVLKERFLASPAFVQVYEDAYRELYATLYASGAALKAVDAAAAQLSGVEGADPSSATASAEQLRTVIRQRTESLSADEVVVGG
jgi:spore coat protein CotH